MTIQAHEVEATLTKISFMLGQTVFSFKGRLSLSTCAACIIPLHLIFPVLFFLVLAACLPENYEAGVDAYKRGDYETAVQLLQPLAEQGYPRIQVIMGYAYLIGKGVPQEDAKAVYWFQKAADQGVAHAQFNLGMEYHKGHGISQDNAKAVYWFQKAADQRYAGGQNRLGIMYSLGHGVPKDDGQAVKWFRLAANQGDAYARLNLGIAYENGLGVTQNYVQADMWYSLAAVQGLKPGVEAKKKIEEKMTPEQITEAQRLAQEWMPISNNNRE